MDGVDLIRLREELIEVGKRLDSRELVSGTEGNLSARLDKDTILVTRSGCMLGRLQHGDFVRVRLSDGLPLDRTGKPTSELGSHLEIYRRDTIAQAIVHAHPKSCIAITLRGWSLEAVPIPEAAYALGSVPTCEFALPGTVEGGKVVAQWAGKRDALLLDRHGAITIGKTPFDALSRMETLDAVAQTFLSACDPVCVVKLDRSDAERVAAQAIAAGAREESVLAWLAGQG